MSLIYRFRKKSLALICLLLISTSSLFAGSALGLQFGAVPSIFGHDMQTELSLSVKLSKVPFVFSARTSFYKKHFNSFGIVADMWLANPVFKNSVFRYFYGPGVALLFLPEIIEQDVTQNSQVFMAPRFVAGVNTYLTNSVELFGQAAMEPGIVFDKNEGVTFLIQLPMEAGFRFWL